LVHRQSARICRFHGSKRIKIERGSIRQLYGFLKEMAMEYAFECQGCGERFHLTESLEQHERHEEKCPKCGSDDVEQRLEAVYVSTSKKS
jgi:putative FmdB family regulatory protein